MANKMRFKVTMNFQLTDEERKVIGSTDWVKTFYISPALWKSAVSREGLLCAHTNELLRDLLASNSPVLWMADHIVSKFEDQKKGEEQC